MTDEQNLESADGEDLHTIGFRIVGEEYGLPLTAVQELITLPRITRVPHAPGYVRGVINLHGNIIPVLDVAARFGVGETALGASARVVVVESEGETVGLLAESVSKVTKLSHADIKPPPPLVAGIAAEYLDGVARLADRFLIFLNLARTLSDDAATIEETDRDGAP
jgi:purine-binding chemotaxis protein CheW